jgi:hypothetical protein
MQSRLNLFESILPSLLRKNYSQISETPSFSNASIGNPDETGLDPRQKHSGVTTRV